MRRPLPAAVLALAVVLLRVDAGLAAAPSQQGWWTATPSAARPDVPSNGLLIEGGVASPTSFAALVYDLPAGAAVGELSVAVAPGSATVPNVTLQLCPLSSRTIKAEQGGAMANAPAFDCARSASAGPSSDGTTYTFDVAPLVSGGVLAVALLPTTPADRVVLAAPDANSLAVEAPAAQPAPAEANASVLAQEVANPGAVAPDALVNALPPSPAPSLSAVPESGTSTAPATAGVASGTFAATGASEEDSPETVALLLLLAGGAVIGAAWLAVGRAAARRTLSVLTASEGGGER